MYLPIAFQQNMKNLLQLEYVDFIKAFDQDTFHGLRINTLKISVEDFLKISPFKLRAIPWSRDGFYINKEERPGKHIYYTAGLYYIQEPSAMLPAEILDVQPGERVLDICAAPGGKSAQLAAQLNGKGVLISNDISAERTKPLAKNLALLGVENSVILNEKPKNLARIFNSWFDAILVDAPCSGEGMFRRDEQATKSWEDYGTDSCMPMQKDILEHAATMLKPGGRLVYSTCTFSPQENEEMIARFLKTHEDFELLPISKVGGAEDGRPEWGGGIPELAFTLRAWPHKIQGEGHFVALLRKNISAENKKYKNEWKTTTPLDIALWQEFEQTNLNKKFAGKFITFANHLYLINQELLELTGLKVIRPGFYLGEFKKKRFEPSHSLALALKDTDATKNIALSINDNELERYLKGDTIETDGPNGWTVVTIDSYGIGWGKVVQGVLKNHYPKGWRKQ